MSENYEDRYWEAQRFIDELHEEIDNGDFELERANRRLVRTVERIDTEMHNIMHREKIFAGGKLPGGEIPAGESPGESR